MQENAQSPRNASVYIPPSYRGNALFLESLGREQEECGKDPREYNGEHERENRQECGGECKPPHECRETGLFGRLAGLVRSDNAVVIAVALFLLFSRKEKKEDQSDDMLTILLLLLVLL